MTTDGNHGSTPQSQISGNRRLQVSSHSSTRHRSRKLFGIQLASGHDLGGPAVLTHIKGEKSGCEGVVDIRGKPSRESRYAG